MQDVIVIEKACNSFAKKWSTRTDYHHTDTVLLQVLSEYEQVLHLTESSKPAIYMHLNRDISGNNKTIDASINLIDKKITDAQNQIIFFELGLSKIDEALKKNIVTDDRFIPYRYYLQHIWRESYHRLSEQSEQIIASKAKPAYDMWVSGTQKLLASKTVRFKNQTLPIHKALGTLVTLKSADRKKLHALIITELKSMSQFAELELNAVITNKKIDDDIRRFKHSYSATVLEYENDECTIKTLMDTIHQHQFIAHKLYKLKAKLIGVKKLDYTDMAITLSTKKQTFSFPDAVELVYQSFYEIDPAYATIFKQFVDNGHIDVYPATGKTGGGYCWGGHQRPTYILLNWTDDLRSVTTLAHEMGHALHSEFSKKQNVFHEQYSTACAEIASTLFENFVFEKLLDKLSPIDSLYVRFNRLQETVATVFRQSAYFQFELDIHTAMAERGYVTAEQFAGMMQQRIQEHLGTAISVTTDDGYLWVRHMHARWFFYVYSYSFGSLISNAMYARYKNDHSFITSINEFLQSGGSDTPENILKKLGIDVYAKNFWVDSLLLIHTEMELLERDMKKQGLL